MPNVLTSAQLQSLSSDLNSFSSGTNDEKTSAITAIYNYLSDNGYGYATLASGLVTGSTLSGDVAKNFMANYAATNGSPMTVDTQVNIELSMAQAYVKTLIDDSQSTGQVSSDITYQEASTFHAAVFSGYNLSPDAWTLYAPGQVLGTSTMENFWSQIISTNNTASNLGSAELFGSMAAEAGNVGMEGDVPPGNTQAANWYANVSAAGLQSLSSILTASSSGTTQVSDASGNQLVLNISGVGGALSDETILSTASGQTGVFYGGQGGTIDLSNSSVTLSANSQATITGIGNAITAQNNASVELASQTIGNIITMATNGTVVVDDGAQCTVSNATTISAGNNTAVTVEGTGTTVTAGTSSTINVTSNSNNDIVTAGANGSVSVADGDHGTVINASNSGVTLGNNTSTTINGSGDRTTGGGNDVVTQNGSGTANLGAGSTITETANNAQLVVAGDNLTAHAAGQGDTLETTGNHSLADTSGNNSFAITTGANSEAHSSGDHAMAETTGYGSLAETTGNGSEAITSGYGSLAVTNGIGSEALTHGQSAEAITNGYGSLAETSGNGSEALTFGANAEAYTSGDNALAETGGDSSVAETIGNASEAVTYGQSAEAVTNGYGSLAETNGNYSEALTNGQSAEAVTHGYDSLAETSGSGSEALTFGANAEAYTSGDNALAETGGDSSVAETIGNASEAVTYGQSAEAVTNGYGSLAETNGNYSEALTNGQSAEAVTHGYDSLAETSGNGSEALTLGSDSEAYTSGSGSLAETEGADSPAVSVGGDSPAETGGQDPEPPPFDDPDPFDDDPVLLNLKGGKVQTTSLSGSGTYFDMQNNGQKVQTGWATAGEGMLVYDPNNTGTVTDDANLVAGFGALSTLANQTGGVLDASNSLWNELKVWVDPTGDANFQQGQLYSLSQLGISSVNLASTAEQVNSNGNTILNDSTFTWNNGTTGDIAGVNLAFNPNAVENTVTAAASSDPALSGSLNNLIQSMAAFTDGSTGIDPAFSPASANADSFLLVAAQTAQHG